MIMSVSTVHFRMIANILAMGRDLAEQFPDWNADDMMNAMEDLFVVKLQAENSNFKEDLFRKASQSSFRESQER